MPPKPMSSRERVRAAFAHGIPDRVPIYYDANAGIDRRLKAHFGLQANDGEGLRRRLGVDYRGIYARYTGRRLHAEIPGRDVDPLFGCRKRWIEHSTGGYWDYCDFPLQGADEETIANRPLPSADDFDYTGIADICSGYGDLALHVGDPGLGDIINSTGFLCGMEQVLIDLMTDSPGMLRLIDRKMAFALERTRRILEAARARIDFVWLGEDLGTQIAPMISLELFRRHIRPRHQKFIDLARSFGLPTMLHSCGSSSWAFEEFIAMGLRAVDTLQPEAANMSPRYLKEKFGSRLMLHGCISTAGPIAYGSVEDVRRNCRETLEIMMPGGGYGFAPTHALQDNSPTANVVAAYEAAHEFGRYL